MQQRGMLTVLSPNTAWEKPTPHLYLCISPHRDSTAPLQDRLVCATDHPRSSAISGCCGNISGKLQLCLEEASECQKEFFVRSMHEEKNSLTAKTTSMCLVFLLHLNFPCELTTGAQIVIDRSEQYFNQYRYFSQSLYVVVLKSIT